MKQDEKQDNLTLSQLIQLRSLAYSRQPLFQRQVSDFMILFYEGEWFFVRWQKMGGWVTGKIDVIMLLIRTSWDKSTKCEVIKCIGQKQSKGDKKWIPNRTPNKPVNSYHSYDLTSQCLCSAHILSVYVRLTFTECFYVTHNIWQQHLTTTLQN